MSKINIAIVQVTSFQQNCTLIWSEEDKHGVVIDPGGGPPQTPPSLAALNVSTDASTADIRVRSRPWGTEITLDFTGLPVREAYQLWTIDRNGSWINAATWAPTPTAC